MRLSLTSVRISLPIPKKECYELLKRIHKGIKATGGLEFVTLCYGIIEIGEICGHRVYEVSKSEIISLRNSSVISNISNSRDENSFQKNICVSCDHESGGALYKKMFVWNEFLTRRIRNHLRNTVWTVEHWCMVSLTR
ncbi:hypothetical protein YC2023_089388 [Brassica napus]